jgi:glycine cleavage system transcriptional repressor
MSLNIVLTVTGTDRVGIVDEVTQMLLNLGGNIETSRMARLGGEFAMLMLVALPSEQSSPLDKALAELEARGYKVTTTPTALSYGQQHAGWLSYQIDVKGADHEGIIHEVAQTLAKRGISIEGMDTGTMHAPNSGTPLFMMTALVVVPPELTDQSWRAALEEAGHALQVDITVSPVGKH